MEIHGNDNDPLAKTLKLIKEGEKESNLGNAGDFFTPVHERDAHIKAPKNGNNAPVEFNSVILKVDNDTVMQKFIFLKNAIVMGDCMAIAETVTVDKEDGATSIFIQWLQPQGMFEIGTANVTIKGSEVRKKATAASEEVDAVDDTQPTKKTKAKGTRKKNTKVRL